MGSGQTAAGVTIPDTKLARDATDLVRDSTSVLVYHHSRRVFWFGSLQGRNGLNGEFRGSGRRFEVDSVRRVWTAIALHTTPGIPQFLEPEVAPVTAGVEYDVLGIGTKASRRSPRRPSATSRPTSSNDSSPATSAAASWTSSRTRTGPSRCPGSG